MKAYSAYKAIGFDFLESIPAAWGVARLKHLSSVNFSNVDKHSFEDEIPVRLCNYVDVYKNDFITPDMKFMSASATATEIEKFTLCKGDVLITKDSESWEDIAVPAYVTNDIDGVLCGYHLAQIRSRHINGKYLFWVLCSSTLNDQYKVEAHGITRYGLGKDSIENSVIPVPSLAEQQAIADFLDCKTAQIDVLIEKKQRQIDLLQEQRTALINHAVTKGLNPVAPMKDSGVEWLGEIPRHWGVKKLKYVTRQVNDGTHVTPTYVDKGIPFLRVTDIQTDEIDLESVMRIPENEHAELSKRCNPEKGDLLLSKNGTIGITKVVDWDFPFSIFVSICLIKFDEQINPYFFSYFFQSDVVNKQISDSSKTTSVTNLHLDKIRELIIIVPSKTEQQELIRWLDKEMKKIDHLVDLVSRHIELLQEYRTALISEAVTGKIDVREWKKPIHE